MYLVLDEAGTHQCKYLVIGGYILDRPKPVENLIKKVNLHIGKIYPKYARLKEIKPTEENIKKEFLTRLAAVNGIQMRYVVADKDWVKPHMLKDENCLINYLLTFIIKPIAIECSITGQSLNIWLDNRTIKTESRNSFADYIKIKIQYAWDINIQINVLYKESIGSVAVQGAHHIVNAIWHRYEYGNQTLYDTIGAKVVQHVEFPKDKFGLSKTSLHQPTGTV